MQDPYWRRFRLVRVIDGDTVQVIIDLGFYAYIEHRLRLLDVNTPELHAKDPGERARAVAATSFVVDWFAQHTPHNTNANTEWPFFIRTEKSDSFGRFLAHIECGQSHSLNDMLLESGNARPFPP